MMCEFNLVWSGVSCTHIIKARTDTVVLLVGVLAADQPGGQLVSPSLPAS